MQSIILASHSQYRKKLLSQLEISFKTHNPNIDETPLPSEKPEDLVKRLAHTKAYTASKTYTNHIIIGSDQVIYCKKTILGKPYNFENALKQLKFINNSKVHIMSGLCVINSKTKAFQLEIIKDTLTMKNNSITLLKKYIEKDKPFDCAGSLKIEKLGISLIKNLATNDPNNLIGLPLIRLISMLNNEKISIL